MKTLEEIKGRCVIEGTHWIWKGARQDQKAHTSKIWGPSLAHGGEMRSQTGTRLVWEMTHGELAPKAWRCYAKCFTPLCLNPAHIVCTPHLEFHKAFTEAGFTIRSIARTLANRKIGAGRAKIDAEATREILASSESGSVLARKYGVNQTTISAIRRGKLKRHLASGVFSGLLAANTKWSQRA